MKPETWKLVRESMVRQLEAGRYNPASVLVFEHRKYGRCKAVLSKGDGDSWEFELLGDVLYVVSWNRSLDYCGIERFEFSDTRRRIEAGPEDSLFLQGSEEIEEVLGTRGLDLQDRTIVKRLIWRLQETY